MKTLVFTGGHHTSTLEVAKTLKKEGWNIIWFGHRHSLWGDPSDSAEYRDVTAAGIKFYNLLAGKFYKTYNPLKLIRIPFGFFQAFYLLLRLHPDGIVSFGGYLAVPVVITGWLLRISSITHEQTVTTGLANKLIAVFAKKIAVTWPSSLAHYPISKAVLTGLPLRPEILKIAKNKLSTSRSALRTIYITGGKNGSHTINSAVFSVLSKLTEKYYVIHQTGFADFETASKLKLQNYECFDYDSQKAFSALKRADVVVSRSGAHSVYELGILGIPSVLIPIPWVSHNEQFQNAQILAKAGLAVILSQDHLTSETLIKSIQEALKLHSQPQDFSTAGLDNICQLIKSQFS